MKKMAACFRWHILWAFFLVFSQTAEGEVATPTPAGIEGTEWLLVEVTGIPVSLQADKQKPFLRFDAEKKQATGFAGCNNFFGNYQINGTSLKFQPIGSTRMACPDLEMSLETEFFTALDKTRTWEIRNNMLIFLADHQVLARFRRMNVSEITGTIWEWVQTQYNDDRKVVPAEQAKYTVQFRQDGTLSVKADCNQKGGSYSVKENRLSINITHSTMAVCPEGSLDDEFVRDLSAAAIYFLQNGDLYIDLKYDTGTMQFSHE